MRNEPKQQLLPLNGGILVFAIVAGFFLMRSPGLFAPSGLDEAEKIPERTTDPSADSQSPTIMESSRGLRIDDEEPLGDVVETVRYSAERYRVSRDLSIPHTREESAPRDQSFDPMAAGEYSFNMRWAKFVQQLELSTLEKRQVKEILIAHEAHNMELGHLAQIVRIDRSAVRKNTRTTAQLVESLDSLLSGDQIESLLETQQNNRKRFLEELARSEDEAIANGYAGIVGFASVNDLSAVLAYIDSGADVNAMTSDGVTTPLLAAIGHGNVAMARALINAGADANLAAESSQETPLRWAAWNGQTEIVNLLVAAGADLEYNPSELSTGTALRDAAQNGHTGTVAALLALGADAAGEAGASSLAYAIRSGDAEMERMLVNAGANENAPMVVGSRALRRAGRFPRHANDWEPL